MMILTRAFILICAIYDRGIYFIKAKCFPSLVSADDAIQFAAVINTDNAGVSVKLMLTR